MLSFETLLEVGGKFVPLVVSTVGLGWWLAGQFSKSRRLIYNELQLHEAKDQMRHEQNLERFSDIRVALAHLGWMNGTHKDEENK